jgi:hypothetical protein
MKKFFVTCIFLFILAGTGFFFGWAQMGIPPDAYGVIRSKSHGIYPYPIKPGEFRWIWYKLIPTNVKTVIFSLNPVNHEFSARNILPSGTTYSALAGFGNDFSWEIGASLSFSLRPDALPGLVTVNNIGTQEEMARYENEIAWQIENFILRRFDVYKDHAEEIEALLTNGESRKFEQDIEEQFPQIENFTLTVNSVKLPNFQLYRQAKEAYDDYLARQKEYILHDLDEKAKNRAGSFSRMEELEQLGALLTRFPVLLEYLAIEKANR